MSSVVQPTLSYLAQHERCLESEEAAQLLVGTAVVESGLRYSLQLTRWSARSYFKIEFATAESVNRRYGEQFELIRLLLPARMISYDSEFIMQLPRNHMLACAVARLHYWSAPEPLPEAGDIAGLGAYWARWYRPPKQDATPERFIRTAGPVVRALWPYSG